MATSSITKNFVISSAEQAEVFVNAVEESYLESLRKVLSKDLKITHLRGTEEVKKYMAKRKSTNA